MRFCGIFDGGEEVRGAEQRVKTDAVASKRIDATLLSIDDTDRCPSRQAGRSKGINRLEERPARRDNVLDDADDLAWLVGAFDAVRSPVLLGSLAHDHEPQPGGERG